MEQKEIIIETRKSKIFGLIVLSAMFVLFGIWIAFYLPKTDVSFLNSEVLRKTVGFSSILFFGLMGILISKKLFEEKVGLKVCDDGIYDNSAAIASGLIKWENIERIEKNRVFNQSFIRIYVDNPEHFINRHNSLLARKNIELNFKKYGSPIQISTSVLNIKFDELFNLLNRELKKRR